MSEQKTTKEELTEQAADQLALLFFQLIVDKNKNEIKKVKKKYEKQNNKDN